MKFNEELYNLIKQNTYICSCCGNIIFPAIKNNEISQDKNNIRGGLGNKILKENVCNECVNKFAIYSNEKWRQKWRLDNDI